ncbi:MULTISPECIES: tyrosine-type recombinase/integrase [unclassified Thiocapsa]|uniref:tyrosine-type recombinase/integrase n=1 Tax=unclassified Thiocapsa TaxID=2641286 RepID=UPI0035AF040F
MSDQPTAPKSPAPRRAPVALSDQLVRTLPAPATGKHVVFDHHRSAPKGFGLRIMASGARSFVLRYQTKAGAARIQTIGAYPTWTLAAARLEANAIRRRVDCGEDPLAERRKERTDPTVADLVDTFAAARLGELASGPEIRRYFDRDLIPALGKRNVRTITRADIIGLVESRAVKTPRAAALLLSYIKLLLSFAEDRELIEVSPATGIKGIRINKRMATVKRGRTLDDDEIRAFWSAADTCGIHRLTALALKLILVTGQRPGEVLGMTETEIEGSIWTIPASRRKTGTGHSIALTKTALALVSDARAEVARLANRRNWPESPYVFEFREGHPGTVAALSKALTRYRPALGSRDHPDWGYWRPHDLRRTCRTRLAEIGIPQEIAERVIGHAAQGVTGVYDRHKYQQEIRAALEAWELRLIEIIGH